MADRSPTEVWIDVRHGFAYVRLGPTANLATVNDPKMAECVRAALQAFVDAQSVPSANGNHKLSEEKA